MDEDKMGKDEDRKNEAVRNTTCSHVKDHEYWPRLCPYNEEIGDGTMVCLCCKECRYQCAMDI